jgi:3-oxoacyl-[acyl-carrier-protein] synthase-1
MNGGPIYIRAVGMACPVGLGWRAACAAIRAGIDRKQELPYLDNQHRPVTGSFLGSLDMSMTAEQRWLHLLAHALADVAAAQATEKLGVMPLILALPADANGRAPDVATLTGELSGRLGFTIEPRRVRVVTQGALGGYQAIAMARDILRQGPHPACLVAAADSLVHARALLALSEQRRLLTEDNSDGVIPGEAAACLMLTSRAAQALAVVRGLGFAEEHALPDNDTPLRGDGLAAAARAALAEAGLGIHETDFRLSDAAGESYYFKEQALVLLKLLRQRKAKFPLWQCADALGDTGAAAGLCGLATAIAGFCRGYAPGPRAIGFVGNIRGQRASLVLEAGPKGEPL